jgi:hypothetical protein
MRRPAFALSLALAMFGFSGPRLLFAEEAAATKPDETTAPKSGEPAAGKTAVTAAPKPVITVAAVTQDNQKLIQATVMREGQPVAGATVGFFVRRTFGDVAIGKDDTFDDGTVFLPFPSDLPGGSEGQLTVIVRILNPPPLAGVQAEAMLPGGRIVPAAQPFPRSLWAPDPPLALVAAIVIILIGVWATYGYVVLLMLRIRKGDRA